MIYRLKTARRLLRKKEKCYIRGEYSIDMDNNYKKIADRFWWVPWVLAIFSITMSVLQLTGVI